MKKISLIVPCYNEEKSLPAFEAELGRVLSGMRDYEFEMIYVNDGSGDGTLQLLRAIAQKNRADRENGQCVGMTVTYISLSRNFGKEAAMYAGFCNATGDYVAVMDADLQDPPALLPDMVKILESGEYDSVATRRVSRQGEPPIRSFFARQFYKMINKISDADVVDGARDYRLMKREMVDVIVEMGEQNRFSKGIFGWIGFRTYWYPYENAERVAGESKWSFWKLVRYAINGIINFSEAPLQVASVMGIVCTVVALAFIIFIVIRKLIMGDPVQGWASTMCVILMIGGVQLFCVGVLGQYLGKTYTEVKKRPHYIVSESNKDEVKKIG